MMAMNTVQIKQIIRNELPAIARNDVEIQKFILNLVRTQFADKVETESRFDRIMNELQRNREEQRRKWDEQDEKWAENQAEQKIKWAEQNKKWAENQAEQKIKWAEQNKKWAEQNKKWAEQNKKWAENQAEQKIKWAENQAEQKIKWAEQNEKWAENQKAIEKLIEDNRKLTIRITSILGAIGSRWGLNSEQSFRNALKAILEDSFDVTVQNITEFDTEGYVFGRPDQIELDIIIKNGLLIIIEIKSSMSRSDMYMFGRKVEFYEKTHNRIATRKMVISPMVDKYALGVAKKLDIEVYSYTDAIEEL